MSGKKTGGLCVIIFFVFFCAGWFKIPKENERGKVLFLERHEETCIESEGLLASKREGKRGGLHQSLSWGMFHQQTDHNKWLR